MGNTEAIVRLLNVGLRSATLVSKFLLVFALAKYLQPSVLGMYGLLVVTVAYSMYPLGFEFYTFSSRELVRLGAGEWAQKLKNQVSLHMVMYAFFMPLLLLLFHFGFLPWHIAPFFVLLVVLEHLNQEAMRLLIALQYQLISSVALFLRQGLWALILVFLMVIYPDYRKLEYVLIGWISGGFLALFLSIYVLLKISELKRNELKKTEWKWILKGIKIALPFLAGTLSLNFIATVDRYWFVALQGDANLGAYVLYMSITAAMVTFMDAGIFSFLYPRLLACFSNKDEHGFSIIIKQMFLQVMVVSIFFIISAIFFSEWFFSLFGESVYIDNIGIFYILVFMILLQALSYIPHYGLYARGKDKQIVVASVMSVPLFVLSVFMLAQYNSMYAIPIGLCIVYGFILIYKSWAYYWNSTAVKVMI